jgi:uncharacterized membrane protein YozB (DUF420 family)/cytochrome oxidase Cu insertion factor (SCO1/SenC/PrrC family)
MRCSLAVSASAALLAALLVTGCSAQSPSYRADDELGTVDDFALTERNGQTIHRDDLKGKVWVASFIFTCCNQACPQITAEMARLQSELAEEKDVLLVSFSVNPSGDDPKTLRAYADSYQADAARWLFLTGDEGRIYHLIRESFHLAVNQNEGAERTPGNEVMHSRKVVLVDREGGIRGYFEATQPVEMVQLRQQLALMVSSQWVRQRFRLEEQKNCHDEQAASSETASANKLVLLNRQGQRYGSFAATDASTIPQLKQKIAIMVSPLPTLNAALNGTSALLLVAGFAAIRLRKVAVHKALMLAALAVSAVFLASYLYYHLAVCHGEPTRFLGGGTARVVYFAILLSHTLLAAAAAPLALFTAYQGLRNRLERHVRIARWTLPIWLYVSLTGVVVYWMLYRLYPSW